MCDWEEEVRETCRVMMCLVFNSSDFNLLKCSQETTATTATAYIPPEGMLEGNIHLYLPLVAKYIALWLNWTL